MTVRSDVPVIGLAFVLLQPDGLFLRDEFSRGWDNEADRWGARRGSSDGDCSPMESYTPPFLCSASQHEKYPFGFKVLIADSIMGVVYGPELEQPIVLVVHLAVDNDYW